MSVHSSREESLWGMKAKALAALVAAMLATSLLATQPALASTTFVVNSTADTPDAFPASNTCDTDVFTNGDQCTLRAAIQQANATQGADTINFAIPGTGVKTINVGATGLGALPPITGQATIDGYTQPGASPNTKAVGNDAALRIVLDGSNAGSGADGLLIDGASNSVIKGLVINRFSGDGIDVFGVGAAGTVETRVEGNFIGTDPTGTLDKGNGRDGVSVFAQDVSKTVVEGTIPAARNLISGNRNGVEVGDTDHFSGGQPSGSVSVQGNYVGTDRNGTKDLGNDGDGIYLEGVSGATIGGTTAASRNVVSGNGGGVDLVFDSDTQMLGNRVGTTASGTGVLGNDHYGVFVQGSSDPSAPGSGNSIGDGTAAGSNTIAFNGEDGVQIQSGTRNEVSRNSIFSNAGLGINLFGGIEDAQGNTANDPGDVDSGANGLQNKPVLSSAKTSSTKTTIMGTLASVPNTIYRVEFYSNPAGTDEGKKFLGMKLVSTDASGNATFTFSPASKVAAGQTVTATARGELLEVTGVGTSEFSAPKTVVLSSGSNLAPDTTKVSGPSGVTKSPTAQFKFTSPNPDATFECSLDGGAYYGCSSPENIHRLSEGRHTFEVRALDKEGNVDPTPAAWIWAVDRNK